MISVTRIPGKDIYHFVIEGKIDKSDIDKFYMLHNLFTTVKKDEKIKCIADLRNFKEFENLETLKRILKSNFSFLKNSGKVAIVANDQALNDSMTSGFLKQFKTPTKIFNSDNLDEATKWLCEDFQSSSSNAEDKGSGSNLRIFSLLKKIKIFTHKPGTLQPYTLLSLLRSFTKKDRTKISQQETLSQSS